MRHTTAPAASASSDSALLPGQCPDCGQANAAERKYCAGCGRSLWEPCLTCAQLNGAAEKFCGSCGVNLSQVVNERIEEIAGACRQARRYRDLYRHRDAVQVLTAIQACDHPRIDAEVQKAGELLIEIQAELEQLESETGERFQQAQASFALHDYEDAQARLEEINWRQRTPEMQALLVQAGQAMEEISRLYGEIREALAAKRTEGLLPKVERLLQLKPDDEQARGLCDKLRQLERRQQERRSAQLCQAAKQQLAAHGYDKAIELLEGIHESSRTPEVDKLLKHCRCRADEVVWLIDDLRNTAVVDEHLAGLAERLLKLQPNSESVQKLIRQVLRLQERYAGKVSTGTWHSLPCRHPSPLGCAVNLLEGLRRIDVATIRNAPAYLGNAGGLYVACGLALQALGQSAITTDLLPARKSLLNRAQTIFRRSSSAAWGIDVGAMALKAVKLVSNGQGNVQAVECESIPYPQLLNDPGVSPEILVRLALATLLQRHSLEDARVAVGCPGSKSLFRFALLPPMEEKKLAEAIKFEARQQIPFPVESVTWDWQLIGLGSDQPEETPNREVGIFAARTEELAQFLFPFQELKIKVDVLQCDTVALYNGLAYDQLPAFCSAAQNGGSHRDVVAVLDLGANTSNLVIGGGNWLWMRNLPFGSNHFNKPLINEFQLTWQQAEELKRHPLKATWVSAMYRALEPALRDFTGELERSIRYFEHNYKDRPIRQLFLVGNGAKLHGLLRHLRAPSP